jgi:hypothetical protein
MSVAGLYERIEYKSSSGHRHDAHPATHSSYAELPSDVQLLECMTLGFELWQRVGRTHGYTEMFSKFPSFGKMYAQLLQQDHREEGYTGWKDLADFVLYQAAVDPSTAALARPSDVVEAQFRADKNLDTFFTACDAACGEGIVAQARHIPPAKAVEQPVGIRFLL